MKYNPFSGFIRVLFLMGWIACATAEGSALLENERNTIDVFQKSSSNVVYVNRMAAVEQSIYGTRQVVASGTGSGILWDNAGHVVTNFHVISGGDAIMVTIGRLTVPAKVVGVEPRKDLALLKISSPKALAALKEIKPYAIAPTSQLLVGQKVIAIGHPFGFDHSLTVGVISALGRRVPGIGGVTIHDMIQTDASINPGHSGGPLLDSSGRLIGLNTVIFSRSGSSAGVGFAVPADEVNRTVTQLITKGHVSLAGVGVQPVTPSLARQLGVSSGILIAEILPNTPAASAGLRATYRDHWGQLHMGDVIVEINGHKTKDYDALYNLLTTVTIGDRIVVTVLREGKAIDYKMKTIDISALS